MSGIRPFLQVFVGERMWRREPQQVEQLRGFLEEVLHAVDPSGPLHIIDDPDDMVRAFLRTGFGSPLHPCLLFVHDTQWQDLPLHIKTWHEDIRRNTCVIIFSRRRLWREFRNGEKQALRGAGMAHRVKVLPVGLPPPHHEAEHVISALQRAIQAFLGDVAAGDRDWTSFCAVSLEDTTLSARDLLLTLWNLVTALLIAQSPDAAIGAAAKHNARQLQSLDDETMDARRRRLLGREGAGQRIFRDYPAIAEMLAGVELRQALGFFWFDYLEQALFRHPDQAGACTRRVDQLDGAEELTTLWTILERRRSGQRVEARGCDLSLILRDAGATQAQLGALLGDDEES